MKRIIPIILVLTLALALSACAVSGAAAPKNGENKAAATNGPTVPDAESGIKESVPAESVPAEAGDSGITKDRAIEIALLDAGLLKAEVRDLEVEYDREIKGDHWDVDFESGKYEYSYEIDAATGKIIERKKELD